MRLLIILFAMITAFSCTQNTSNTDRNSEDIPDRTILLIIDGLTSGIHNQINLPGFEKLMEEGVLYEELYTPLAAHPDSSATYPWTTSIPNPVRVSGTIFIGQEGIHDNLIQHSFNDRPTAFLVNSWAYTSIAQGTIYKDYSEGDWDRILQDELPVEGAKDVISEKNPEFLTVHMQGSGMAGNHTTEEGHPYTKNIWHPESPYVKQNQYADSLLVDFVNWLKNEDLWEDSVLLIMGDHGQAQHGGHPPYNPESNKTQMLIVGKNIKESTTYRYAEMIDIAPTITWLHQVDQPKFSDGRILKEVKIGNRAPKNVNMHLKNLNAALIEKQARNPEVDNDSVLNYEEIGSWHEKEGGNNYQEFINIQTKKIYDSFNN